MGKKVRATIATSETKPAPWRVLCYTVPLWGGALLLSVAMPLTAVLSLVVLSGCLFILPFKARRGLCPHCQRPKLVPFSGVGGSCKGCGVDLVLRNKVLHYIEAVPKAARPAYTGGKRGG
ncbi:MAG: hypothetical protein Q9M09_00650 [Mariprofundaceae bacterium]|nr:hypothetical protein [Mariprofundaceae bacterium]